MNELLRLVRESSEFQLVAAVAGVIALVAVAQWVALFQMRRRLGALLRDSSGQSLEALLRDRLAEQDEARHGLEEARGRIERLETKMEGALRYVGVSRYDAFGGLGGQLSFSLAFYDEKGDGAVLTSQVGRQECRVYCKQLSGGKSEWPLADEESEAIRAAARVAHGGRTVR
jgi:hypothetical protein